MRFWRNLIGYQAVWFASVIAAANGRSWLGAAVAFVFVVGQLIASSNRTGDIRLVAVALLFGVAIDGALASSGWLRYASSHPALIAPIWILSMWAAFAMTLNHSLAFLQQRSLWAVALGLLGGPLAYVGASRGFGVLEFQPPGWRALAALAFAWAIALPALAQLAHRWRDIDRTVVVQELSR